MDKNSEALGNSQERQETLNTLSDHLVEAQAILQRLLRGEQLTDVDKEFLDKHLQESVKSEVLDTTAQETKTNLLSVLGKDEQDRTVEKPKDVFDIFVGSIEAGGVKKQNVVGELQGDLHDGVFATSTFELKLNTSPSEVVEVVEKLRIKSKVLDEIRNSSRSTIILDVRCIFDSSSYPKAMGVNPRYKKQEWNLDLAPRPNQEQTELDVDVYDTEQSPPILIIRAYPAGYFQGK